MSEYLVEIEGRFPLDQIALQIESEEAGGSEFIESDIAFYNNRVTNIGRFKELPPGTRPAQLRLIQGAPHSPLPANTRLIWSGLLMVENAPQPVLAFR